MRLKKFHSNINENELELKPCLLRNLYPGQATVRTRHGTMDWFKIGKGVSQGYILSPCLFNLYAELKRVPICYGLLSQFGTSLLFHVWF